MATYWHRHPRGFANECDIVRAEGRDDANRLEEHGYDRLTRTKLAEHVRWINDENDAWGSNRAFGRISLKAITTPNYRGW